MAKTSQELFKEKLALIYEFNKQSPLFVRAAELQVERNNLTKAAEILIDGIRNFSEYPTGYIMLGNVLALSGDFDKAEEAYVRGSQILNSKETLEYYINELEKVKRSGSHFTESRQVAFFEESLEAKLGRKVQVIQGEQKKENSNNEPKMEDNLDDLAKKISSAKIVVDEVKTSGSELERQEKGYELPKKESEIVSETMANIYISQAKFREAIEVYKKLLLKNPEKKNLYQQRIAEIESQIAESGW